MSIQIWCLLLGVVLPYIWAGVSVPFRTKQFGDADLRHPRVQGEQLVEQGARVWGAQSNAWEALIVFAAANLAAFMAGVAAEGNWAKAAMIWAAARILHGLFYMLDLAPLRIAAFLLGLGMSVWVFVMALTVDGG